VYKLSAAIAIPIALWSVRYLPAHNHDMIRQRTASTDTEFTDESLQTTQCSKICHHGTIQDP